MIRLDENVVRAMVKAINNREDLEIISSVLESKLETVLWPETWPTYRQNYYGETCNVVVGYCNCGAYHKKGEFTYRSGVLRRHGTKIECSHKPCVICDKKLQDISRFQPFDGGQVKISFSYGSKLDGTNKIGVICDSCAEPLLERMLPA